MPRGKEMLNLTNENNTQMLNQCSGNYHNSKKMSRQEVTPNFNYFELTKV